jgi:hypothetical protein
MRFRSLVIGTFLLISVATAAQHYSMSGGGSSSEHSSGASADSGSFSNSGPSSFGGHAAGSIPESSGSRTVSASAAKDAAKDKDQPDLASSVSRLLHGGKRPEIEHAKTVALREPVCKGGSCETSCPRGSFSNGSGSCVSQLINSCSIGTAWNGSSCMASRLPLVHDCSDLQPSVAQQARLAQSVAAQRAAACGLDPASAECVDLSNRALAESNRYDSMQRQYQECHARGYLSFAGPLYSPRGGYQLSDNPVMAFSAAQRKN